ncbi:hypothetical protein BDY24DRAFT_38981 [Mrakia frigida]|uniref:uncharacterized protein n=1 Tax=Mrakia frigida TaxID=29902 RepID=UPI003FCC173C
MSSENTATFLQILQLLAKISECVQSGAKVEKTTALLKETVGLVSCLSVAILVPDMPQHKARGDGYPSTSPKVPSVTSSSENGEKEQVFYLENSRSSTTSVPTSPSSPSSTSGTSPSPSSNLHQHMSTPMGGPGSKTFLQSNSVNRGLLTPPPSDGNKPTWSTANATPGSGVQTRIPGSPMATPLAGKGSVGLGLGLGGSKDGLELPLGFESTSDPTTSDSDFYLRAMFHRLAGAGVQEAYDATLKLSGATILDGVLFRFKITDAYFNPETYNYSESLSRDDGFSGFRYNNKNGSVYIRFEEPTGPRISFIRHANPPYVIPYSSPSSHLRTPLRSPPAAANSAAFSLDQGMMHGLGARGGPPPHMQQIHQLRAGPLGGERVMMGGAGGQGAGANKFSVQDFWN